MAEDLENFCLTVIAIIFIEFNLLHNILSLQIQYGYKYMDFNGDRNCLSSLNRVKIISFND